MRVVASIVILILIAAVAAAGFVYVGGFNVGADHPDGFAVRWLLHTTMERSVARHASTVGPAPNLDDPGRIREGAEHYKEMCMQCHLAPGMSTSEIREGLNPQPPELAEVEGHMSPQELFWIIKHGVRMTAMPAWGKSHSDQKIWAMVAFIKHLPGISETQFRALAAGSADRYSGHGEAHDHHHD